MSIRKKLTMEKLALNTDVVLKNPNALHWKILYIVSMHCQAYKQIEQSVTLSFICEMAVTNIEWLLPQIFYKYPLTLNNLKFC